MTKLTREEVLSWIANKTFDEIDELRNKKYWEYKDLLSKLAISRDSQLTLRFNKRKQLLEDGNSLSRTGQLMLGDFDLYQKKLELSELRHKKEDFDVVFKVLDSYFWRSRNQ